MKKKLLALFLASFGLWLLAQSQAQNTFTLVNNTAQADALRPSVVVSRDGTPIVAWLEQVGGVYQVFVKRWLGGKWQALGASLNLKKKFNAFNVWLALSNQDVPYVAWTERSNIFDGKSRGPGKVYVARWESGAWKAYPSPSKKPNSAGDIPSLAVDSRGNPVLAWSELTPDFNADSYFVERWDGTVWQPIDPGTLSSDISHASRSREMVLNSQDQPVLAWSIQKYIPNKGPQDFNVYVGGWNGKAWQPLGNTSLNINPERYAAQPSFQLDKNDYPVVAWLEASSGFNVVSKRWTGKVWQTLGKTINQGTGLANSPRLRLEPSGTPLIAWVENAGSLKIMVVRFENGTWKKLGMFLNVAPKSYADTPSLAVSANAVPVVAWSEEITQTLHRVYIKKWNGKAWVGL